MLSPSCRNVRSTRGLSWLADTMKAVRRQGERQAGDRERRAGNRAEQAASGVVRGEVDDRQLHVERLVECRQSEPGDESADDREHRRQAESALRGVPEGGNAASAAS